MKIISSALIALAVLAGAVAPAAAQTYYDERSTYSYDQEYQTDSYDRRRKDGRAYSYDRNGRAYFYGNDSQITIQQLDQDGRAGHHTGGGRAMN